MKHVFIVLALVPFIGCSTKVQMIGELNMISHRNINLQTQYKLLSSYSGGTKKEVKKSEATTIQEAMNTTIKNVPGGEFVMNAKIWMIDDKYFAVEGDVYGSDQQQSYRGFTLGDRVIWKSGKIYMNKFNTVTIKAFKDSEKCIIVTDDGKMYDVKYDDLSKTNK